MKKQQVAIQKPNIGAALSFAKEAAKSPATAVLPASKGVDEVKAKKTPQKAANQAGGRKPPEGDIRLTCNISKERHKKLKKAAIDLDLTVGELIEHWVDSL